MAKREYLAQMSIKQVRDACKRLLAGNPCFLDTETTGLTGIDEIVQIGIIDKNEKVISKEYLKPIKLIDKEAQAVHGISMNTVASAQTFNEYSSKLDDILKKYSPVVIYNEKFDLRLLSQTAQAHRVDGFEFDGFKIKKIFSYDAMLLISQYFTDKNNKYVWMKLVDAYDQICIFNPIVAHDAIADCTMMLRCVKEIANSDNNIDYF